jgi:hypothetical protein
MSKALAKKILEHPDKDEIVSKLVAGSTSAEVSEWLKGKYVNPGETRFALSADALNKFSDGYLDFYLQIRDDVIKTKENKPIERQLRDSIKNNKSYKERLNEIVGTEVDIKKTIRQLIVMIEARAEQVFDEIQNDPSEFRGDNILINWFNTLLAALEKGNKLLNDAPDQVIQHNVTVQVVDQHVNVFYEAIKETLETLDYESSLKFMEMFNQKMLLVKATEEVRPATADVRLAEAKLLSEKFTNKMD